MIRLTDAALLAYTKLRARKLRLIVTVVISSLLFGVLALSSFVVRGIVSSVDSFSEEGFGKRYLVSADPSPDSGGNLLNNKEILDRAVVLHKEHIARKKIEAKRLGIEYDSTTERPIVQEYEGINGKEQILDFLHPLARQAVQEYLATHPSPGLPEVRKLSQPYQAIGIYESRYLALADSSLGELKVLKDGKESFDENSLFNFDPSSTGIESFTSNWSLMSSDLLKTFTLDGSEYSKPSDDGSLPIVAPYTAVEQLLGLKPVLGSATASVRLERLKQVRAQASTISFGVCYRNASSADLISQAINTKREIEQNKTKKDYQKPKLIYETPTEPCGAARVVRDVRTAEEKKLDGKQLEFRRIFGEEVPVQSIITFKVIGVSPDPPAYNSAFLDGLIGSILSSNIGANWFTPLELRVDHPVLTKFFPDNQNLGRPSSYIVELPNASATKKILDEANCKPDEFGGGPGAVTGSTTGSEITSSLSKCESEGKPFLLVPYGSSSVAIDELQNGFNKVFKIAALVVIVLAGLIMMGTVGRIVTDARRETAVFRAIGAKRLDIAQVYITYALVVSALIGLCAILAGYILAQIAQTRWGTQFTVKALVAYNAQDLSREFRLYTWYLQDLVYILLAALSAGLVSTIFPLIRNIRRNPIRDMRDEN